MTAYWYALGLTLLVEVPAYASALRSELQLPARRGAACGLAVNLASHPLAFLLLMPRLAPELGFVRALLLVELVVWFLEGTLLWGYLRREPELAWLVALLANALSLAAGVLAFG